MNSSWVQIMSNPQGHMMKQYMEQLLKEKYFPHQEIIERMSKNLTTMGDIDAFAKFISEIYQTGYLKAVKDYEESLNKLGYKVKLTPATPENKIFSQEKSGCSSETIAEVK